MTDLVLATADGVRLTARWWRPPPGTPDAGEAVVVVHGFCGRKDGAEVEMVAASQVAAGRRVLVNGAGGGSGSFAIQLAKRLGAHVTGVDNAAKLDFMRSLGADEVIDYTTTDATESGGPSDIVLDHVGTPPAARGRPVWARARAREVGGGRGRRGVGGGGGGRCGCRRRRWRVRPPCPCWTA